MTVTEFYTKRNESIINRFKELKAVRPKKRRPEIMKIISAETEAKGDKLSTFTLERIISDATYMPQTRKKTA